METIKKMSMRRRGVWALQLLGLMTCGVLWAGNLADIAWFTGAIALGVGSASTYAESRFPGAGDWLGLVVLVAHLMSIAVSGAAYGLEGASSPWAVVPGIIGLALWFARPKH